MNSENSQLSNLQHHTLPDTVSRNDNDFNDNVTFSPSNSTNTTQFGPPAPSHSTTSAYASLTSRLPVINAIQHSFHECNSFKIAFWNACGVGNKMTEVEAYMRREDIHIMLIAEIRTPADATCLLVDGYKTYTALHPNTHRKGGVATLVREDLDHVALQPISHTSIQCAPIALMPTRKRGGSAASNNTNDIIIIGSAYSPPGPLWQKDHYKMFFNGIENLAIRKHKHQRARFIICADWNAKHSWWGNTRSCPRGRTLAEYIREQPRYNVLATGGSTHFPFDRKKRPSAIDFAVYSGIEGSRLSISSRTDLDSDHLPLVISMHVNSTAKYRTLVKPEGRLTIYDSNVNQFRDALKRTVHTETEIRSSLDVDDAISILMHNITEAAKTANKPWPPKHYRRKYKPDHHIKLDKPTRNLWIVKQQRKAAWLATRTPLARRQYKTTQNLLKKAIKHLKERQINKMFEEFVGADGYGIQNIWKLTNKLKRQPQPNWALRYDNQMHTSDTIPPQSSRTTNSARTKTKWTKTAEEKAEVFVSHLEERFSAIHTSTEEERALIYREWQVNVATIQRLEEESDCREYLRPFTLDELETEISQLENGKAPGPDKIDNRLIKALPSVALEYLLLIYNGMLRYGYFPKAWKHATVSMIPKPGKNTADASSYRPISLLSGLSKIFERLLLTRLLNVDEFANAVPSHQFGFRREHGTEQQLARVSQFIMRAHENKEYCSAVFIDIAEAFDRVWHDGLLSKLAKLLPFGLYRILANYLDSRTFNVRCNDGLISRTGKITAGVPQGSVLGPILYTIYSSDMPLPLLIQNIKHMNSPSWSLNKNNSSQQQNKPSYNQMPSLLSTYADDTVIMQTDPTPHGAMRGNETYLQKFCTWAQKWSIKINSEKTGHVLFATRKQPNASTLNRPRINGTVIPTLLSHTYLGIKLDTKLTLKKHVSFLCGKLKARATKLEWLIGPRSKLHNNCKAIIIRQLVMPIWQYALPLWGALVSNTQLARVQRLQNKIIRRSLGVSWYIRNEVIRFTYNLPTIEEVYEKSSTRYAISLASHTNPEAKRLALNPFKPQRLKRPRYERQIELHIEPQCALQQQIDGLQKDIQHRTPTQQHKQLQHCPPAALHTPQHNSLQENQLANEYKHLRDQLPTLLRQELDLAIHDAAARHSTQETYNCKQMEEFYKERFGETTINSYRRKYRDGIITRAKALHITRWQPIQIRRIIIPDIAQAEASVDKPNDNGTHDAQLDIGLQRVSKRLEMLLDDNNSSIGHVDDRQSINQHSNVLDPSSRMTIIDLTTMLSPVSTNTHLNQATRNLSPVVNVEAPEDHSLQPLQPDQTQNTQTQTQTNEETS